MSSDTLLSQTYLIRCWGTALTLTISVFFLPLFWNIITLTLTKPVSNQKIVEVESYDPVESFWCTLLFYHSFIPLALPIGPLLSITLVEHLFVE